MLWCYLWGILHDLWGVFRSFFQICAWIPFKILRTRGEIPKKKCSRKITGWASQIPQECLQGTLERDLVWNSVKNSDRNIGIYLEKKLRKQLRKRNPAEILQGTKGIIQGDIRRKILCKSFARNSERNPETNFEQNLVSSLGRSFWTHTGEISEVFAKKNRVLRITLNHWGSLSNPGDLAKNFNWIQFR